MPTQGGRVDSRKLTFQVRLDPERYARRGENPIGRKRLQLPRHASTARRDGAGIRWRRRSCFNS